MVYFTPSITLFRLWLFMLEYACYLFLIGQCWPHPWSFTSNTVPTQWDHSVRHLVNGSFRTLKERYCTIQGHILWHSLRPYIYLISFDILWYPLISSSVGTLNIPWSWGKCERQRPTTKWIPTRESGPWTALSPGLWSCCEVVDDIGAI